MDTARILDQAWYDRLVAITRQTGETYNRLLPPADKLARLKTDFLATKQNPNLIADHLEVAPLKSAMRQLETLQQDITSQEPNALVREAYDARIRELIDNHQLLIASATNDMASFAQANLRPYDKPDYEVFAAGCAWIRKYAEQAYALADPQLRTYIDEVLELIPDLGGDDSKLHPDHETFMKVRHMHEQPGGYYEQLFGPEGIPAGDHIGQALGDAVVGRIIKGVGSDYTLGYSLDGIWAVLPSIQQVVRPKDYYLERTEFICTVSHEVGSHLLETVNGEKQPLRLLSSALAALAGYEKGNEGRALLREQIVYDSADDFYEHSPWGEYAIAKHIAISLGYGVHDHPHTFAEVFEIMRVLHNFWFARRQVAADTDYINTKAWDITVRVLKGTAGAGGAYLKDKVYLEGNIRCWELAATQPEMIFVGDQGKFDITNPDHIRILRGLHII